MAVRVTTADFDEKVLKNQLPVIVDFYSDSCVVCKKIAPVLGDIEDDYEGKLEVVKVNTNFDSQLSERYSVMSNPTLIVFKNQKELGRKVGAVSYDDLEEWFEKLGIL